MRWIIGVFVALACLKLVGEVISWILPQPGEEEMTVMFIIPPDQTVRTG